MKHIMMYLTFSKKDETERVRHTIRMLLKENFILYSNKKLETNAHIEMEA